MADIFKKIFKSGLSIFLKHPGGRKYRRIALSLTIKEIASILHFRIFGEYSKIQNGRHFENFLKSRLNIFLKYPEGRKFRRNCSISQVKEIATNLPLKHKSVAMATVSG